MRKGDTVKLLPKDTRTRELIELWGDQWEVVKKKGNRVTIVFDKEFYDDNGLLYDSVYLQRNVSKDHIAEV